MMKLKYKILNMILSESDKVLIKESLNETIYRCNNQMSDTIVDMRKHASEISDNIIITTKNCSYLEVEDGS